MKTLKMAHIKQTNKNLKKKNPAAAGVQLAE